MDFLKADKTRTNVGLHVRETMHTLVYCNT